MAHRSQEFVLVEYSEFLERRPLKFLEPIPPALICSVCGKVPRMTFSLLCGHVLCEPCYRSCATTSDCVCPLDGDVSGGDDVTSKKYPAENLLRRKVHCWNEVRGCGVVLPASEVAEHVRRDCQNNVTRCPKCWAPVLSLEVNAHLESRCTELVFQAAPEPQQETGNSESALSVPFVRKLEQRVSAVGAKLAQLCSESASQSNKLVEVSHNINHLKETIEEQFQALRKEFVHTSVHSIDRMDQNEAEMTALVPHEKTIDERVHEIDVKLAKLSLESACQSEKLAQICHYNTDIKEALIGQFGPALDFYLAETKALSAEQSDSLRTTLTSVLASVPKYPGRHQRVMTGYSALKEKARKDSWSRSLSDQLYLLGYQMSWGISFRKDGESVYITLCFQLHEGREDEFLQWPFMKEMKLSIIHPKTREELQFGGIPSTNEAYRKCYCRPIGGSNRPGFFGDTRVDSRNIERDGYVKRDELLLRFEVLL